MEKFSTQAVCIVSELLSPCPFMFLIAIRIPAPGERVKIAAELIESRSNGARYHEVGKSVPALVESVATWCSDSLVHACCCLWALSKTHLALGGGHDLLNRSLLPNGER